MLPSPLPMKKCW